MTEEKKDLNGRSLAGFIFSISVPLITLVLCLIIIPIILRINSVQIDSLHTVTSLRNIQWPQPSNRITSTSNYYINALRSPQWKTIYQKPASNITMAGCYNYFIRNNLGGKYG